MPGSGRGLANSANTAEVRADAGPGSPRKLVRIGGLMRCCLETLGEYEGTDAEGTVLPCKWCSDSIRVREGVWEWNHD